MNGISRLLMILEIAGIVIAGIILVYLIIRRIRIRKEEDFDQRNN